MTKVLRVGLLFVFVLLLSSPLFACEVCASAPDSGMSNGYVVYCNTPPDGWGAENCYVRERPGDRAWVCTESGFQCYYIEVHGKIVY